MVAIKEIGAEDYYVVMATRNGLIKRTRLSDFANIRSTGIIAIDIEEGDELRDVRVTDGTAEIMLCTRQGMAIRFAEDQVRAMGRTARGVRGINLREDDAMVGMAVVTPSSETSVVTVCERGYGKRTLASEFSAQKRGGLGLIAIKTTERNGPVVGSRVVEARDDLMLITDVGKVIRMSVGDLSLIGRNTQGVRLIRLEENERVVGVERLAEREDDDSKTSEVAVVEATGESGGQTDDASSEEE